MKEIPLSRGYVALVDDDDFERVSAFKWSVSVRRGKHKTYTHAHRHVGPKKDRTTLSLHTFIMGHHHGMMIDHADGNGLNNQKYNLRVATRGQNVANSQRRDNAKKYRGTWRQKGGQFVAQVGSGPEKYIGTYETEEEAARAYDAAAVKKFGEFARLNFPREHSPAAPTAGTNDEMFTV